MSNRLAKETSPYLLQHKDNPVDWYHWCGEAFEVAKKEDKPIFLSIGYSACHWCHVLAHESFDQDADTEGEEGKYYLFTPEEIIGILEKDDGERFNRHFDITDAGNFEGKNIPNLLESDPSDKSFESVLPVLYDYRKKRYSLHRDEKILTSWNSLMIAAMCELYLVSKKEIYLTAAQNADSFIRKIKAPTILSNIRK